MLYAVKQSLQQIGNIALSLLRILRNPTVVKGTDLPIFKNDHVLILGNGPSLKEVLKTEMDMLKNSDTLAVNKFCLSEAYVAVQPIHYVVADPDFFHESEDSDTLQMKIDVQSTFETQTTWEMNLFLPNNVVSQEYAKMLQKRNPNIHCFFFNMLTIEGPEFFQNSLYQAGWGMPFAGNVLIAANMLAINMGYVNIELYGAEHSIHTQAYVNEKNQVALEYDYFDGSKIEAVFWDDLDPTKPQKYHQYLTHWTDTFKAYHDVESFAKSKNCRIRNMTNNSYIDAFERANIK